SYRRICGAASPGIAARRWPAGVTSAWPCRPRSTSAIHIHPGSGAATRTPTGCCGSGSKKAPTSAATPRPTSNPSRTSSTPDPGPPWTTTPPPNASPHSSTKPH
ncbi:uncharacterized protein RMCFA_6285, partial [Mycolicibacterium fortuitum subsp. acetamidolyticum]